MQEPSTKRSGQESEFHSADLTFKVADGCFPEPECESSSADLTFDVAHPKGSAPPARRVVKDLCPKRSSQGCEYYNVDLVFKVADVCFPEPELESDKGCQHAPNSPRSEGGIRWAELG